MKFASDRWVIILIQAGVVPNGLSLLGLSCHLAGLSWTSGDEDCTLFWSA